MSRQVCKTVYPLEELSEAARETARQWYKQSAFEDAWYETVYEDAANIADILGIDLRTRKVRFNNGETRYDGIDIIFSGFHSQGDGACFQGTYCYAKGAAKAIREYAPIDSELHRIADGLQAIQRKHFYKLSANVKHSGRYCHEFCTNIDVVLNNDNYDTPTMKVEGEVVQLLRDFMRWIYRELEKDYEFQNSNEVVDENIQANGFEFTEDGKRTIVIH